MFLPGDIKLHVSLKSLLSVAFPLHFRGSLNLMNRTNPHESRKKCGSAAGFSPGYHGEGRVRVNFVSRITVPS